VKQKTSLSLGGLLLAVLAAIFYPRQPDQGAGTTPAVPPAQAPASAPAATPPPAVTKAPATTPPATQTPTPAAKPAPTATTSKVGFTSRASWQSHFEKHGAEFGKITADEYLALAQKLRDAPLSANVLEDVRESDGVITRFDRQSGGFVAFHKDKSIRTFFRPDDGEAYFRRQAAR
jgi:hypothetical protein